MEDRERADFNTEGDWGSPGRWAAYGNRPDFRRQDEFIEKPPEEDKTE